MNSRVWFFCDRFYPDDTSTSHYSWNIARHLARVWTVTAVATVEDGHSRSDSVINGVAIKRLARASHSARTFFTRLWRGVHYTVVCAGYGCRNIRRGDVVIMVTNPPMLPLLLQFVAKIRGATAVFLVHDVYPDALVAAGLLRNGGFIHRILKWLMSTPLWHADVVVACGRDMQEILADRLPASHREKVRFIPNWSDDSEVVPVLKVESSLIQDRSLAKRFVLQFVGNIGRMQPLDVLLAAAGRLSRECPDVVILVVGSGNRSAWFSQQIQERGCINIELAGSFPRSHQQSFLAACDVAYIGLIPGMQGVGVPSRLYNILAAGRPVIAQVDEQSEIARVVREEGIGWVVRPGDVDALVRTVLHARASVEDCCEMGVRARRVAESRFSKRVVLDQYSDLISELIGRPASFLSAS